MLQPLKVTRRKSIMTLITVLVASFCATGAHGQDKIRVGYGSLSTSYAAIWVAGEPRLFQKNGIDAEVLYLESALVRTALLTGDIAMGGMSGTTMAAPRLKVRIQYLSRAFQIRCSTAWSCGRTFERLPISRASASGSRALVQVRTAARRSCWPSSVSIPIPM